jgi:histidinol-phosphate phosphatase family protein
VFFDRDGVVNRSPGEGYVERWEDFELMPGFAEVLSAVSRRGYAAVIVTNQSGVARGVMTRTTVEQIHGRLEALLEERYGERVLDILYCPHDDGECTCRKPQPGMILQAAAEHGLDLGASWMVGDSERDIVAGRRAGCRTVLVGGSAAGTRADVQVADMRELASRADAVFGR